MPHYLISYDITDNQARNRAYRILKGEAGRLQYSVFIFSGTSAQLTRLRNALLPLLDADDTLFILPVCDSCYNSAKLYGNVPPLALVP